MTRRDLLKGIFATAAYTVVSQALPSIDGVSFPAKSTLTFEKIVEETMRKYRRVLHENIMRPPPLYLHFKKKGLIQ